MKKLVLFCENLLYGSKYGAAKILAMAILVNMNFTGYGLDPGKIGGSQKICYGSKQVGVGSVSQATISNGDEPDEYVWQYRTFDPDTDKWNEWIDYKGWDGGGAPFILTNTRFTQTTEIRRQAIYGICEKYSNIITITVNPLPEAPKIENVEVCFDEDVHTVELSACPEEQIIVWYKNATGPEPANEPSQKYVGTATAYAAIRTTATGCESERVEVTVTVNASPSAEALQELQEIKDVTECYNGQEYKIVEPAIAGHSIVWYSDENKTAKASTPSLTQPGESKAYPAIILNETGCESAAGNPVSVTVTGLPAAPSGTDVTECFDGNTHTGKATAGDGEEIVWYAEATGTEPASAPSRSEAGITAAYAAAKNSNGCESKIRTKVTVTINALPEINEVSDITTCSGGPVNAVSFSTTVSSPEVLYSWEADGNWSAVGLPLKTGTGDIAAFTAKSNTGTAAVSTEITVTPKIGDCTGEAETFTITVNPVPTVTITNTGDVCVNAIQHRSRNCRLDKRQ